MNAMLLTLLAAVVAAQAPAEPSRAITTDARERARKLGEAYVLAGTLPERKGDSMAGTAAFQDQRARVHNELTGVEHGTAVLPEWAGRYFCGDGLGLNLTYCVAPRAGVYYEWTGCMGSYDSNYGSIESVDAQRIRIKFATAPEYNWSIHEAGLPRPINGSEWCYVPWGELRYMIPTVRMVAFCNAVNAGNGIELCTFACRGGDRTTWNWMVRANPPASAPLVPPEFAPFLLDKPVQCEIVAAQSPVEIGRYNGDTKKYQLTATVKCDRSDTLLPGMLLHVVDANAHGEGIVVSAAGETAQIEMRFAVRDALRDVPQVGWHLSTKSKAMEWERSFADALNSPAASQPAK